MGRLTKLSRPPSLCHQCTPAVFLGSINTCCNRNGAGSRNTSSAVTGTELVTCGSTPTMLRLTVSISEDRNLCCFGRPIWLPGDHQTMLALEGRAGGWKAGRDGLRKSAGKQHNGNIELRRRGAKGGLVPWVDGTVC